MIVCPICLEEGGEQADGYHNSCVVELLGPPPLAPRIFESARQLTEGDLIEYGRGSISGVQPKVLTQRSADGTRLEVVGRGGLFIVKPQTNNYRALPENEHTTMIVGRHLALDVPPCGLVRLGDHSWGYVIRRFDRSADGVHRFQQEDFCALAELPPEKKYDKGSGELCAKLLRRHVAQADYPGQVLLLFRQFLFSWWIGNGDLHLKNLSLATGPARRTILTPAYDLVSTELVIPGDGLALPIRGKRSKLRRSDWLGFGAHIGIEEAVVEAELSRFAAAVPEATQLIMASYLPGDMKHRLVDFIYNRSAMLHAGVQV